MNPVVVARSVTIAAPRDAVFDATLPIDLAVLFHRWFGPIPPIRGVRDQDGPWARPGQTRTVELTGGGSMHERLTGVDAPASFSYRLTQIRGALAPLVDHVEGLWSFEEGAPGSTTVTWQWTLHPRSVVTRPLVLLVGRFWNGYARRALDELEQHVNTST